MTFTKLEIAGQRKCNRCGRLVKNIPDDYPDEDIHCSCEPIESSLPRQGLSFTKAIVAYLKSGLKKVTREQYEERLQLCNSCQHRDDKKNKCMVCGCKLESNRRFIISKAMLPEEKCPIGKWPIIETKIS